MGQRFILLLAKHPHFKLHTIGASERSSGKKYKDVVQWKQSSRMSAAFGDLEIKPCQPEYFADCDIVFSGLDSSVAGDIGTSTPPFMNPLTHISTTETAFVHANLVVFSNAKNHRQSPLTPLIVPTVNLSHFSMIPTQQRHHNLKKGFLVCNSNCAVIGLVIPFAAIQAALGPIDTVSVVTEQALSGAGYPGVSAMDIKDNIVPYISGEEEKMEPECRKILGAVNATNDAFVPREDLRVSAMCSRVDVTDGHTAFVSLRFAKRPPPSAEEVKTALSGYVSEAQELGCPSAPERAVWVHELPDRPQPRLDRDEDGGYCVHVGRVREDPSGVFDLQFVALSHNTVIGAAGSSILNAEAAVLKGLI